MAGDANYVFICSVEAASSTVSLPTLCAWLIDLGEEEKEIRSPDTEI